MRYNNRTVDRLQSFEGRFKPICKDVEAATEAAPARNFPVTLVGAVCRWCAVAASLPASDLGDNFVVFAVRPCGFKSLDAKH